MNITVSANVDSIMQAADYSAVKTLLSLNNVENTAISTFAGSANLVTVGTLTGGATGAGFTVALGASTLTGDLPFANFVQASAASKLVGRGSASGAGDYQEITIGTGLTMTGTTLSAPGTITGADTQVLFFDGANAPAGDAGFVYNKTTDSLTVNGTLLVNVLTSSTFVQAGAASVFFWTGRSVLGSPSNGVITLSNQAITDFGRLQFGGTTSSFPALKRNATGIDVRLADDSGFAPLTGSNLNIVHSALTYAATTDLDFAGDGIKTVALTGNVTFTTSNKANNRSLTVRIQSDGSVRSLAFPAGWKFFGATPVSIAGSKEALLALQCFGAAETDVRAMYNVEP